MDLAVNRLQYIFKPSTYKCDSAETLKDGISFPNILIVSNYVIKLLNSHIIT